MTDCSVGMRQILYEKKYSRIYYLDYSTALIYQSIEPFDLHPHFGEVYVWIYF